MEFSKKFVCEDREYSSFQKNVPAPLFRKSLMVESEVQSAELLICGLGFYDLFVNGRKITKGYLAPYISNSDHITYFDKYDLKPFLQIGENVIGIMLGDGNQAHKASHWDFDKNITNSAPLLALSAEIKCSEKTMCFEADAFVCKKGPVLFNDLRAGVFYDARLEEDGWNEPGYDASDWHQPIIAPRPRGYAKICEAEPVKVYREIKPVSVREGEADYCIRTGHRYADVTGFEEGVSCQKGYIYDFGENNSGIFRLRINGQRGQKVSIQCAEQLKNGKVNYTNFNINPDGFSQRDIYYLKGEGEEVFEPMFTYHGFRYLFVTGITKEQATSNLLTYLVMSSDLQERGTFRCSDEMANKIYEAARRSDRSNFYYFPVDCPHREKNGWTADASVSAEHMIMTISAEHSWGEWLNNIRCAQTEEGKLPGIIPTGTWGYQWGNGPAWDSVLFELPYIAWKYRGETKLIKENASAMLRYLEYISRQRDERGLIAVGLGDWVPVGKAEHEYEAELGFTDSVMVLDISRKASVMFGELNLMLHKAFADQLASEVLESIRREYVDFDMYLIRKRCQTSQAMAIFYDVLTPDEKPQGFRVLMDILKEDNYKLTCGVLGTRVLYHVLSEFGESELAYKMITGREFPSYGYYIENGETTLPEQFLQYVDGYYRLSKNHHFLGDIVNWFMSRVGGLQVENSNSVKINPYFIEKMDWCRTSHELLGGNIEIQWKRTDDGIELTVSADRNIETKLIQDDKYIYRTVGEGKYQLKKRRS